MNCKNEKRVRNQNKNTENYEIMENTCRLCLEEREDLEVINDDTKNCVEMICLINCDCEDFLPNFICVSCLETVRKAFELRILSQKNDVLLREKLSNQFAIKVEMLDDMIKYESSPSCVDSDQESVQDTSFECVEESVTSLTVDEPEQTNFICDYCSAAVSSKRSLKVHIKNEHFSVHSCPSCDKHFKTEYEMVRHHKRIHVAEKLYICDQCNANFNTGQKYDRHKEIHKIFDVKLNGQDKKVYQCRLCPRVFEKHSKSITDHIYHHNNRKKTRENSESLVCPHCGQIYRSKQILTQHIRRHFDTGDKYPCPKCPQKFKTWCELYYHSAVHTVERNFICDICNKGFKAKRDLRNHKVRHAEKDVKKFQCSYCQLMLKNKFTLNRHILIHTGEKPFNCT